MLTFFLEMPQNSNSFNFGTFSVLHPITCLFLKMSHFQCAFFLAMPHCSHLILHMGKCGIYRKNILPIGYWGGGVFWEKSTWSCLKQKRYRDWNYPNFGAFQGKIKISSHEKILSQAFHRLFIQGISRNSIRSRNHKMFEHILINTPSLIFYNCKDTI